MKKIATLIALFTVLFAGLLVPTASQAADIVLHGRATRQGAIVRLGDIADIGADTTSERKNLASTPLLPAPARGTVLFLNVSQVRDLLTARGIRTEELRISGAKIVELGSATITPKQVPVTSMLASSRPNATTLKNSQPQKLSHQEIEQHVQTAIEQHLQQNSEKHWRVEVSLAQRDVLKVGGLSGELTARGQAKLRSGSQRFFLRDASGGPEVTISARLVEIHSVVVLRRSVERGQIIRASDVEIQEQEGNLPTQAFVDLALVIGKEAKRTLRIKSALRPTDLREPLLVRKGEAVDVFVRTGGIVVRTSAVAKQDGAKGELVMVETIEDKRKLNVTVSGPGEVVVYATGGRTTDYASLGRDRR